MFSVVNIFWHLTHKGKSVNDSATSATTLATPSVTISVILLAALAADPATNSKILTAAAASVREFVGERGRVL
jgi:hypothetical protein